MRRGEEVRPGHEERAGSEFRASRSAGFPAPEPRVCGSFSLLPWERIGKAPPGEFANFGRRSAAGRSANPAAETKGPPDAPLGSRSPACPAVPVWGGGEASRV
uniref:Uncharacterized protein n=1 Tax=Sphaerodactylus townsendi TaxID=933632 RepID=A0ACB8FXI0_9SAUR